MHFSVLELSGAVAPLDLLPHRLARAEISGEEKTEIFRQNFPQTRVIKSSSLTPETFQHCPRQATELLCESEITTPLRSAA